MYILSLLSVYSHLSEIKRLVIKSESMSFDESSCSTIETSCFTKAESTACGKVQWPSISVCMLSFVHNSRIHILIAMTMPVLDG